MFLQRVSLIYDSLTPTERIIADYLCGNADVAKNCTSYELSSRLNIGQSTIIRFSQKMGYDSYVNLQIDLAMTRDGDTVEDISVSEPTDTTNAKIMRQYKSIIDMTYMQNSAEVIDAVVHRIDEARRIMVFGIGSSCLFATYFTNQLIKIGMPVVICPAYPHVAYSVVSGFNSEDLVILISESGTTPEILTAAKTAKANGVPIVAITRNAKNKLYDYADFVLKTVNSLSQTRLEAMALRGAQMYILDSLYLNLFKLHYDEHREAVVRSEAFTHI